MSVQKLISNYASYNAWANKTVADWLKTKSVEILDREAISSFTSITSTINHIVGTQRLWHLIVTDEDQPEDHARELTLEAEEALEEFINQSEEMSNYVAKLNELEIEQRVVYKSPWVSGELPRYEFLLHAFNHSTYHRGQIITIGRNVGLTDAPMADYNFFNMMTGVTA